MRHLIVFVTFATALASPKINYDHSSEIKQVNTFSLSLQYIYIDFLIIRNWFQLEDATTTGNDFTENDSSLEENLKDYLKTSNFSFKVPIIDSTILLDARKLDSDELNLKFDFGSSDSVEG